MEVNALSMALGEGMSRSQAQDAQMFLSLACNKIQDCTANVGGATVYQQMLQQDRRVQVRLK